MNNSIIGIKDAIDFVKEVDTMELATFTALLGVISTQIEEDCVNVLKINSEEVEIDFENHKVRAFKIYLTDTMETLPINFIFIPSKKKLFVSHLKLGKFVEWQFVLSTIISMKENSSMSSLIYMNEKALFTLVRRIEEQFIKEMGEGASNSIIPSGLFLKEFPIETAKFMAEYQYQYLKDNSSPISSSKDSQIVYMDGQIKEVFILKFSNMESPLYFTKIGADKTLYIAKPYENNSFTFTPAKELFNFMTNIVPKKDWEILKVKEMVDSIQTLEDTLEDEKPSN